MSRSLDDPKRQRGLTAACNRLAKDGRHPGVPPRYRTKANVSYRIALSALIACAGLAVPGQAGSEQLLTIAGYVVMQARILHIRQQLDLSPALAVLSQLPVEDRRVFAYQLQPMWRAGCWAALDAAGFWAAAWCRQDPVILLWLPLVAVTHALVTMAMAWVFLRIRPMPGCAHIGILGALVWAIFNHHNYPALTIPTQVATQALAWATPWGWMQGLIMRLPSDAVAVTAELAALCLVSFSVIRLRYAREQRSWQLAPWWREVAGQPLDAVDAMDETRQPASGPLILPLPAVADDEGRRLAMANSLARARALRPGRSLPALGWAGRRVWSRLSREAALLADVLDPRGYGSSAWRWAMLITVLCAICACSGLPPFVGVTVLGLMLLWRRKPWSAALIGVLVAASLTWPLAASTLCIAIPTCGAVLMTLPMPGGTWGGLPMGVSELGSMPRTWRQLHQIMTRLTALRIIASGPVVILAALACGFALSPVVAAALLTSWSLVLLNTPWITGLKITQRSLGGVFDLSLGRPWLTLCNACCLLGHAAANILLVIGLIGVFGDTPQTSLLLAAIGGFLSAILILAHVALLRYAYRYRLDFIPPL